MKRKNLISTSLSIAIALNNLFLSFPAIALESNTDDAESFLDYRKETIYFLFLDRFSDGDTK